MFTPEQQDGFEKSVQFGCGFLLGGIVLLAAVGMSVFDEDRQIWVFIGIGAFLCGLLAIRFGDRFFNVFFTWFRWWP